MDTKWLDDSIVSQKKDGWGAEDLTTLKGAVNLAKEVNASGQPWFINVLTAGTHHPFNLPSEWQNISGLNEEMDSFAFLDDALSQMYKALNIEGLLENTLLIITNDEAAGQGNVDSMAESLSHHHAPLYVKAPGLGSEEVLDVYAHSDLALSVCDFLSIESCEKYFVGRSLFRKYNKPRFLAFSNVYARNVFALWDDAHFTRCDYRFLNCLDFNGAIFSQNYEIAPTPRENMAGLQAFVTSSDWQNPGQSLEKFRLVNESVVRFRNKKELQTFFISPMLFLNEQKSIYGRYRFKVLQGSLRFEQTLSIPHIELWRVADVDLKKGDELNWTFEFPLPSVIHALSLRGYVTTTSKEDVLLQIEDTTIFLLDGVRKSNQLTISAR